jgi:hypothetical protein
VTGLPAWVNIGQSPRDDRVNGAPSRPVQRREREGGTGAERKARGGLDGMQDNPDGDSRPDSDTAQVQRGCNCCARNSHVLRRERQDTREPECRDDRASPRSAASLSDMVAATATAIRVELTAARATPVGEHWHNVIST